MSLNLSARIGFAHNTGAVTDVTAITNATFDGGSVGKANKFRLAVDTTAAGAAVDLSTLPVSMLAADGTELFVSGAMLTVVKANDAGQDIIFPDPLLGTFSHINLKQESLTLIHDGVAWIAQP